MFDFLKILKKKFQKWLFWDMSNRKRNKVTNFGEPSPTSVETINKCMVAWEGLTHPQIGLIKKLRKEGRIFY